MSSCKQLSGLTSGFRRFFPRCFLVLASVVVLTGGVFGRDGETVERVSFRAQGQPLPTQTNVQAVAARAVLRAFLERYPHYDIEAFSMPVVGGTSEMDAGPLMAISAGIPPHAIYVNFRQSSTFIEQGFLDPLEILLARVLSDNPRVREADGFDQWLEDPSPQEVEAAKEAIRARVPELTWPVIYRLDESGRSSEKHVWAMPYSNLVQAMFYRKDLFFEAGLDPEKPPETWDEFMEFSRLLRVPERQQYAMLFGAGMGMGYTTYNFFISNGARAMIRDEDGQWRASFGSREAAEAIFFVWRLIHEPFERDGRIIRGAAGMTTGNRQLEWERGKVGIQFGYLNEEMLATINPQLVGIAPLPVSHRGHRGGELNAQMLGVFSNSSARQKLAVMRYIWFMTGEEAQEIRTRIFVENGFGQFVNPNLLEKFGYERLLRRVPPGWRQAFEEAMATGVPEPYGRNTQNIYLWMSEPISDVMELQLHGLPEEEAIDIVQALMQAMEQDVNRRVVGIMSEEEMRQRRMVGGAILSLMFVAFAVGLTHIWRYFSHAAPPVDLRRNYKRFLWGFVLVGPGFGLILMWHYVPLLVGGLSIAFMDYRIVLDNVWVGLDNFANVLYDDRFWSALGRSFYFVALAIGIGFWPPILLAILLHEVPTSTAKYFYRTVFYLPSVLSGIVVMFLWKQLYEEQGLLNQMLLALNYLGPGSATLLKALLLGLWLSFVALLFWLPIKLEEMARPMKLAFWLAALAFTAVTLHPLFNAFREGGMTEAGAVLSLLHGRFHITPYRWLQSPEMAMLCIVIPMVWAASGPGCIIYLAALKGIPEELYEAADIDGAGNWHKIFYIVLPRLKYLIIIQFVAAVIAAFRGAEEFILVMTGGGPGTSTTVLSLEIFFRTFMDLNFGLGTAMAWMMGSILIGFTAYQLKILSNAEFKAAG